MYLVFSYPSEVVSNGEFVSDNATEQQLRKTLSQALYIPEKDIQGLHIMMEENRIQYLMWIEGTTFLSKDQQEERKTRIVTFMDESITATSNYSIGLNKII